MEDLRIRVARAYHTTSLGLFIHSRTRHAVPLELEPIEDGAYLNPIIEMEDNQAQMLMDSLYDSGVRPSHGVASAGQTEAMQNHIDDMRTILFKKMGI